MCTFTVHIMDIFFTFTVLKKFVEKFKINNRTVQNKHTVEKFRPEKIIAQYLIRIVKRENLDDKNYRTCPVIRYLRVCNLYISMCI